MTVLLLAASLVVATGAIAAVAPSDARLGLVGLTATLVAAALVGDPLPDPGVLAVRLSAALLAVAILRTTPVPVPAGGRSDAGRGWSRQLRLRRAFAGVGVRDASRLGWPAVVALGVAGAAAGLAVGARLDTLAAIAASAPAPGGGGSVDLGSELTSAAGLSLGLAGLLTAIAVGPALFGRLTLRGSIAALLLVQAAELARLGFGARPSVGEEIVVALVLVVAAGVGASIGHLADATVVPLERHDEAAEP